jgi:hypothetical protein
MISDLAQFALWALSNPKLYNSIEETDKICAATGNTTQYEKDKSRSVKLFLRIIASHTAPEVQRMAEWIVDPIYNDSKITVP